MLDGQENCVVQYVSYWDILVVGITVISFYVYHCMSLNITFYLN